MYYSLCFVVLGRVHRGVEPRIPRGVRMPAGRRRRRPLVGVPRERGGRAGRRTRARGSARLISWAVRANHSVEKCVCLNFTGLRKLRKTVPWIWSRARRLLAVRKEMPSPSDGDASGACTRGDTREGVVESANHRIGMGASIVPRGYVGIVETL